MRLNSRTKTYIALGVVLVLLGLAAVFVFNPEIRADYYSYINPYYYSSQTNSSYSYDPYSYTTNNTYPSTNQYTQTANPLSIYAPDPSEYMVNDYNCDTVENLQTFIGISRAYAASGSSCSGLSQIAQSINIFGWRPFAAPQSVTYSQQPAAAKPVVRPYQSQATQLAYACPAKSGTAEWGPAWADPRSPTYPGHEGLDVFGRRGTPIYSATYGYVRKVAGGNDAVGYRVWIEETDAQGSAVNPPRYWFYNHMSSNLYRYIQALPTTNARVPIVRPGTRIGDMDNTGSAAGGPVHLHLGIAKIFDVNTSGLNWAQWYYPKDVLRRVNCLVPDQGTKANI